jgi:hypothetical protein
MLSCCLKFPRTTPTKHFNSALQVKRALESIPEVLTVHVTFPSTGLIYACQSSAVVVTVEFLENFGALPPMVGEMDSEMERDANDAAVIVSAGGEAAQDAAGAFYGTTAGTKEADECAGRGFCMSSEGQCICYQTNGDAFDSSDGTHECTCIHILTHTLTHTHTHTHTHSLRLRRRGSPR